MTRKKAAAWAIPKAWPVQDATQYRPISWFVPYGNNARTHPPEQVTLLGKLIAAHGPDQPIVVDEKRVILKGHGRRMAAIEAGIEQFTFIQRTGLSEEDKAAMRIQDNAVSLLAGWDKELLRTDITALKASDYDLRLLGFGDVQLVQFTTTPGPPAGFQAFGEDIPTTFCCPSCRHSWSGNPMAGAAKKKK